MNSYATEQLGRQRHDQFAREAHGDRLARNATPLGQPRVGQSPVRRRGGIMWRLPGAVVAGISRQLHPRRGVSDLPIGRRATDPRRA